MYGVTQAKASENTETEMVTLERIDSQKKQLLASSYFRKAAQTESGYQIKPQSLYLESVNFAVKSRFAALINLLENQLVGKVKHFILYGSAISSAKLQ